MRITTTSNLSDWRREFQELSDRRFNSAIAAALTRTAVKVKNAVQEEAKRALDNPTPYTLRQLRYTGARADNLVAVVGFNIAPIQDVRGNVVAYRDLGPGQTPAGKYLQFQTEGGTRRYKRFELALQKVNVLPQGWFAVPGQRANLDIYGNQNPGELRQILSWFDAAELVAGSRQNMGAAGRAKRMKGTRKVAGFEYFVVREGDRRTFTRSSGKAGTKKMQPGIYRRTLMALGTRIEPIVIFVKGTRYKKRYLFNEVAQAHAAENLPQEIKRALTESQARFRSRSS